jgi:hypothetical protein
LNTVASTGAVLLNQKRTTEPVGARSSCSVAVTISIGCPVAAALGSRYNERCRVPCARSFEFAQTIAKQSARDNNVANDEDFDDVRKKGSVG